MIPLTRHEERLLRGREKELGEITENCRRRRLTVITSEPGLGVTSLLEAGVWPALRREGFIVVVFRDWQGKFFREHLREAIEAAVREQADSCISPQSESLGIILRQVREQSGKTVIVLFDQFEDYLRCQTRSSLSETFDTEVGQAIALHDAGFVIGMQEQALPAFERLNEYAPNLLGYHIRLNPLSREAAKEAIDGEARERGSEVTPAAMEALISAPTVLRPDGVHPFYLKVATSRLFDAATRLRAPAVDIAMIELSGGVDRIVLESLDSAIESLNPTQLELIFRWCNILISPDGRRVAIAEKGLTDYAGKLNRFVPVLLPIVTAAHLMRSVESTDAIRYEIARECLLPILRNWRERRETIFQSRQRAAFLTRSISIAVTCLVVMYVVWIVMSWKQGS